MNLTQEQIEEVWNDILTNEHTPQQHPQGFVLGSQSGDGKSSLIQKVKEELKGNVIVINGNDCRKYHSDYVTFQAQGAKDSAPKTQEFVGKMTEAILKKGIKEKYNIVIESTFRAADTPIKHSSNSKKMATKQR